MNHLSDILRTPSGLLLIIDGHHRFAQALLHDVEIWTEVYSLGDLYTHSLLPLIIDENYVAGMVRDRRDALLYGHKTLLDFYANSFKVDWNSAPFNKFIR